MRAMRDVPARLLLGGEGPLGSELRGLARETGADVEFVGRISEADLPAYYYASEVFCLPSVDQTEAFGLVQAEAMACGIPIVNTSLDNGVNELAPDNVCAISVKVGDSKQLAKALRGLLANEEVRCRLGAAGRERVGALYTIDSMVNQTLCLYEKLLGSRRKH